MGLFNFRPPPSTPKQPEPAFQLPIQPIDLCKRYDVYCAASGEERLYENVCFIGIRTFDRINNEFATGLINGYLEIELADGTRLLIPTYGIQLICEHGTVPAFKVVREWGHW